MLNVKARELAAGDLFFVPGGSGSVYKVELIEYEGYVRGPIVCDHNPGWSLKEILLGPEDDVTKITEEETQSHQQHRGFIGDKKKDGAS